MKCVRGSQVDWLPGARVSHREGALTINKYGFEMKPSENLIRKCYSWIYFWCILKISHKAQTPAELKKINILYRRVIPGIKILSNTKIIARDFPA